MGGYNYQKYWLYGEEQQRMLVKLREAIRENKALLYTDKDQDQLRRYRRFIGNVIACARIYEDDLEIVQLSTRLIFDTTTNEWQLIISVPVGPAIGAPRMKMNAKNSVLRSGGYMDNTIRIVHAESQVATVRADIMRAQSEEGGLTITTPYDKTANMLLAVVAMPADVHTVRFTALSIPFNDPPLQYAIKSGLPAAGWRPSVGPDDEVNGNLVSLILTRT